MLNPFYRIESVENDLVVWNIYRDNPILKLKGTNANTILKYCLDGSSLDMNNELLYKLSQRGILLDEKQMAVYSKLLAWTEQFEAAIDRYRSSEVIIQCLQKTDIRVIMNEAHQFKLTGLSVFSGNANAQYFHYLLIYETISELQQLVSQINRDYCSTVFLCKVKNNTVLEIGPCYQVTEFFCFDCMVHNLDNFQLIYTFHHDCSPTEMLEDEYLKALIDYYTLYMTTLAKTHERKVMARDYDYSCSTVIPPHNPRCSCYHEV
jgi:hypothetical protein